MSSILSEWIQSLKNLNFGWYEIPLLSEIRKAYRKLSLEVHSDKCHDCSDDLMKEVNKSYEFFKTNYTAAAELHQAAIELYRDSMDEAIGELLPFADIEVSGNEEILGRVLADFGVDLSEFAGS